MRRISLQGKASRSISTVSKTAVPSISISKLLLLISFPLFLLVLLVQPSTLEAQTINATQKDVIIIDNGSSGKADPLDRIRYEVTIQNTGGATGTGVQLNIVPDPRTTLVPGSYRSSPLALNDSYTATGNVGINVPAASGVKSNDFDDNLSGTTLAITNAPINGTASLNNDGSFTYTPNAGFTGTDNFSYTITDGNGVGLPVPNTDVATVTITVSNLIWFIDNTGGGSGGTGTLASPFKLISNFNAASGPDVNQLVFIKNTGTNYVGPLNLENGQLLFGTGHTGGSNLANVVPFVLAPNSNTLPAINGTRPVIQNNSGDGINVAMDNTIRGLNVGDAGGLAIRNTGTTSVGNLVINDLSITNTIGGGFSAANGSTASMSLNFTVLSTSGGNGMKLVNCLGTVTVNGGTISGGTALVITGGTVTYTSSGIIIGTTGFAVDIDNHDSNNITQSGNVSSTGSGIRVQNCGGGTITFSGASKSLNTGANAALTLASNGGGTINFSGGGLVITTTSGIGFNATGGGTVNVTGSGNTITSTTGTALNVVSTNIGGNDLNFQSISANGATNGIVLNTTGSAGGLMVTGTGSSDGTGGTIQSISARGVSATNTADLSLKNMIFTNANTADGSPCGASDNSGCNAAIYLNTVTNATLDNVNINGASQQGINLREVNGFQLLNSNVINGGAGGQTEEANLYALNLFGTCAIANSSLTVPAERAAVIYNTSKTMALTVTGSTFGMNQTQPLGADGLEISSFGTSNTTLDIVNSTFVQPKTNGLQVITEDNAHTSVDITGCTFDPGPGLANAMDLDVNGSGDMDFNVIGNPSIKGKGINIINIFAFPNATFEGRINNNTVVNNGGSGTGIRVISQGNGANKVEITGNNVTGANDYGIDVVSQGGSGRLDATIKNNVVSVAAAGFYSIHAAAGASSSTFTNKVCANVANNTSSAAVGSIGDYQARAATASHEIILQGGGTTVPTSWSANANAPLPGMTSQSGAGVFSFGGVCNLPTNPLP